jgi:cycloeucalenol cycloisomerase
VSAGRWLSANPAKAWAERYFLAYSLGWIGAVALVVLTGWIHQWHDVGYLVFSVLLGGAAVAGPWILGGGPDRAKPWWTSFWFKLNVWVFILVAFGTYVGTHYFFDLMGMRYAFPVTWTLQAEIVGHSTQTVPVFMYPLTQAYFVTYFVGMTVVLRKLDGALGLGRAGRVLAIVGLAYVVAWMETFTMASDYLQPYFEYADKGRMLSLGSFGYASYFVVGLPLVFRIDEHADERWPLGRVAMEASAACLMILGLLELWAHAIGPLTGH